MPYTPSLETTDFPHKDEWSENNLPEILFYIELPASIYEGLEKNPLLEDGKPVMSDGREPRHIRDFEVLPRNISLDVPGWLVEAWRHLDTRISYRDILDRQQEDPDLGLVKHSKNALQNHCRRECRKVLNSWVEYGRRDEPHRTEVEAIEGLTYENIVHNTTLNRCNAMPDRLVKVRLERRHDDGLYYAVPLEVTSTNRLETTLPLDHFLHGGEAGEMTQSMSKAWEMYLILTERAEVHGLDHWSKLPRMCLPVSWYDRTRVKSVPNDTYDGGCAICTWSVERAKKDLARDNQQATDPHPSIKFEPNLTPVKSNKPLNSSPVISVQQPNSSPVKSNKRHRRASSGDPWDLGDTPKGPKRRYATRLSLNQESGQNSCNNTPDVSNTIFIETYKRKPGSEEHYRVGRDGELLPAEYGTGLCLGSDEDQSSFSDSNDEDYEDEADDLAIESEQVRPAVLMRHAHASDIHC